MERNFKNILILTSQYKNAMAKYETPVVHYYALEWMKMGFNVNVIHYQSTFPRILYFLANKFTGITKKLFKTDFIPLFRLKNVLANNIDGIPVTVVPLEKILPHLRFRRSIIKCEVKRIEDYNKKIGFEPDIILGHFFNPQLEIIPELKNRIYKNAICSLVIHEDISFLRKRFKEIDALINEFHFIGLRNKNQFENFERDLNFRNKKFICYSGIPNSYLVNKIQKNKFNNKKLKFCFVGMLIPLKNIEIIIRALHEAFPQKDFEFSIIGDGMLRVELEKVAIKLNLEENIIFHGRLNRDEVQNYLDQTDIFIMVSAPEAFGLVYLEAMSKGCVVIGSVNQGIDGVIIDGLNGYLCEPGCIKSLSNKLKHLKSLRQSDLISIGEAAKRTAENLTDEKVAINYLRHIIKF